MSDELARAVAQNPRVIRKTRVSCSVVAWNLDDVGATRIEVIANVFRERFLFMAPRLFPGPTAGIPLFIRALFPGGEHFKRVRQRLRDHHACIELKFSLTIFACMQIAVQILSCIEWHSDGGLWGDAPPVEQPFEGKIEMLYGGISVNEDDKAVRV